ncbi:sugar ABC transporter substrate-binding protein [Alsobacter metallidurans]|uniref:Sugar ABC transporter substrate-binding protein n=1 Tax=Alsobacter metallidurans TaxID=340221 RepID=A0A917I5G8_9HYPH|nr:polysaccharide biosynthesis/export family protein [Alsobacter metallidurans]GGH13246.1 sugar ABC transporter substrate-binding protein [Alsobacter metallidurans]
MLRKLTARILGLVILVLAGTTFANAGGEYLIGPDDHVRLKVHEWRASRGEAYEWTAMTGEYVVSASGALSLPLIGEVAAEALTVEQLSNRISERLQKEMGLVERPTTSLQISQFRPFYVAGEVTSPGAFPYRPGLTVLKAISIAGGIFRRGTTDPAQFERASIASRGDLTVFETERLQLMARRARLQAEIEDRDRVTFPTELTSRDSAAVQSLIKQEQALFDFRRKAVQAKLENLTQARAALEEEIATLRAKDASNEKQLVLARRELTNVTSLADKGLTVSARQLAMEQTVAQLETARLDVGVSRMRIEQERSKLGRDVLDLTNLRRTDALTELRTTEARIAELTERSITAQQLIYDSEVTGPRLQANRLVDDRLAPQFSLVRQVNGQSREFPVDDNAAVLPGDVVRVKRPMPEIGLPVGTAPRANGVGALSQAETNAPSATVRR